MASGVTSCLRVHPDKCKKDFDAEVAFLTQYIDKRTPAPSVKVASVTQTRAAKWQKTSASCGTFKEKIELKGYSREEYGSMLVAQCHQLYELQKKAMLIKGNKTQESSRALETRVAMLEAKTDNSSNEILFPDKKPKANNRNNPTLDRKGNGTIQSHADT